MPREISRGLFERAQAVAATLGLPSLRGVLAPGGSDGQFTAAMGIRTLDGLGAVGGHAHAEGEWVEIERMPERAALLAALVHDLLSSPRGSA
jgi:glutamate carboxypeptidase